MMKKVAFIVVVAVCAFWACDKESVNTPIEKIEFGFIPEDQSIIDKYGIEDDGLFVGVNNSKVTNVNQYPVYARRTDLKYSSSDTAIVKIDSLGIITGVGKGSAYVYAESTNSSLGLAKAALKVYVDTISVEKVTVSLKASSFDDHAEKQVDTLFLNDTAVFSVAVEPLEASFADYVWTSSNPAVLEVDAKKGNVIKAKSVGGSVTLTGNLKYGGTEETKKEYTWVVEEAPLKSIGFAKRKNFIKILPQENQPISIIFDPQYASNKSYTTEYYEADKLTKKKNNSIIIEKGFLYVVSDVNNDTTWVVLKSGSVVSDTTFFKTRRVE